MYFHEPILNMIHDMLNLIEITKTNQVRGLRYQCNNSQVVALLLYSLLIANNSKPKLTTFCKNVADITKCIFVSKHKWSVYR